MSVGWRPAEKKRDRQLLQSFTCAAKDAPAYQVEVQRYLRNKAQAAVNRAPPTDDAHLLLLFDDDELAGIVMHAMRPDLPRAGVAARVVEYIGVSLVYQGADGRALSNGERASRQLLGLTFAHVASRPLQPEVVAAAIHERNLPSARLFASFGVRHVEPLSEPYRLHWGSWDQSAWPEPLPSPLP